MEFIIQGFLVAGGLIVAIGAQNAFVLKQGLLKNSVKNNIFWVCLVCFFCDAVLITIGVLGFGKILQPDSLATLILSLLGSLFLIFYGLKSFYNAFYVKRFLKIEPIKMTSKTTSKKTPKSLQKTLLTTLAITLLNPHVYLDTVVVIGAVANSFLESQKLFFLTGAIFASFFWFFSLGYGAKLLSPLFQNNKTWKILDILIGCIMFSVAFLLLKFVFTLQNFL